jgi:hypothetical protein
MVYRLDGRYLHVSFRSAFHHRSAHILHLLLLEVVAVG